MPNQTHLKHELSWYCVALLIGGIAIAQTNAEINAGIQFNLSTPGAKNLALGSAFISLADDATAAYSNPAGLIILSKPEVSLEIRNWDFTHSFTDAGRLEGDPTGIGVDTTAGLRIGEARNDVTGASFFSYVYPRPRWAVAFYRHELANFKAAFETQGAFLESSRRLFPARSSMDLEIVNHGIAAARRFGQRFSLGLGLSYYDMSFNSTTRRYLVGTSNVPLFDPPNYSNDNIASIQSQNGQDTDWGLHVGFLWQLDEMWSIGGIVREGPDFDFAAKNELEGNIGVSSKEAKFHTPDVIALGAAVKPTDEVLITLDIDHIQYSELTTDFVDIFGREVSQRQLSQFKVDDATELHLGFEYAFLDVTPLIVLRAGIWYDPDHKIRFEGDDLLFKALFRSGSDEVHYAAGFGLVSGRLVVDLGFDYSDRLSTAAISMTFRH